MIGNQEGRTTLRLRRDDLDWREIDNEIVVLDGRDAVYLAVRGSGAMLWRQLAQSTTRDCLVRGLVERYAIAETEAATDVDTFLATLHDRGLLAS